MDKCLWIKVIHSPEMPMYQGFAGFELYTCGKLYPPVEKRGAF